MSTLTQFFGGGGVLKSQLFTASGTWTRPAKHLGNHVLVTMIGGGGSGGRAIAGVATGGRSGVAYQRYPFAVAGNQTVTIGLGGAAKTTNGIGNVGGNSSFGTLVANGGSGGGSTAAGTGGSGSGHGGSFGAPTYSTALPGIHGSPGLALAGAVMLNAGDGTAAGYGAGGATGAGQYSAAGRAGRAGAVLVEWWES